MSTDIAKKARLVAEYLFGEGQKDYGDRIINVCAALERLTAVPLPAEVVAVAAAVLPVSGTVARLLESQAREIARLGTENTELRTTLNAERENGGDVEKLTEARPPAPAIDRAAVDAEWEARIAETIRGFGLVPLIDREPGPSPRGQIADALMQMQARASKPFGQDPASTSG